MKNENTLWIDYIAETFGHEVLDRVELMARYILVERTDVFLNHVKAFGGKGDYLGYVGNKPKSAEEIWQTLLDEMKAMESKHASEQTVLHNFIFDEFLGQVLENYYNQFSAEQAISVCREILSNKRVRALYKMRPTNDGNGDADTASA